MLILMVAAVVLLLSVLPMARLMWELVAPQSGTAAQSLTKALSAGSTWTATWNSLQTGVAGTVLAMVLGTTTALIVSLTDVRGRGVFVFLYVIPLLIAPQVTALAWLQLFGPASPFLKLIGMAPPLGSRNPLYSPGGIILLLGVQYGPMAFLMVRAALRRLPRELVEAALSGGASRFTVLRTIILPLITPALIGAAALVFVSCVGNFGIPAFLGIPANYLVLPTLIYQKLAGAGPAVLTEVTILSIVISLIAMAGIVAQDFLSRRRDYRITTTSLPPEPFGLGRWRILVEAGLAALILAVLVLPLTGLTLTSMITAIGRKVVLSELTLANYGFILTEHAATPRAFVNSFGLSLAAALVAVMIAVPLGYMIAWQRNRWTRALNLSIELPYALPGVVLAIASLLLFLKPIPVLGIQIYNTIWIILFAYCARFLVLALRPTIVGYQQIDRALEEAAQVAGAGLMTRLRTIIFPLVAPATLAGGCLIFLTALSELTVSALLWSSGSETIGVVIFSFEQGGDSAFASAVSVMTVIATVALMLATNLFARRLPNGVLPWRD
ncbi:ABC transporter permease [Pseudogemmobacter humi]|uniref:2-aminoethylphosphonate transport system permease protein PhnV n=1 Tax=Pseudogemmobacter humi TaxID=2483812 RepID=A0A3P5XZM2_9RHOB|nr:iron ABC transporter permease [Pseudogemmobacter humi]VDC33643.1 Putative 2-aminoethylphosphonate transport system permease protein PhnV [Pseudogemmobacter humi]